MKHRNKKILGIITALLLAVTCMPAGGYAQESAGPDEMEDLVVAHDSKGRQVPLESIGEDNYDGFICVMKEDAGKSRIRAARKMVNEIGDEEIVRDLGDGTAFSAESLDVIGQITDPEAIEYIEPDYNIYPCADTVTCNDTYYSNNKWIYNVMDVQPVWAAGITGQGTGSADTPVVAVMDSGIAGWSKASNRHEDLNYSNMPYAIRSGFSGFNDTLGHGTFVVGEIAAIMNNKKGVTGLMPDVKIIPVKVLGPKGGKISNAVIALNALINEGNIDVVNMSFGATRYSSLFADICKAAASSGMILVAAAGNEGKAKKYYPASYKGVVSVGSIGKNKTVSYFSEHNKKLDVVAPGNRILGVGSYNSNKKYIPSDTSGYWVMSGTSMAAPMVTALAAMAKSLDNTIDHKKFMSILKKTSTDRGAKGYDKYYGWGIVNYNEVYKYIVNSGAGTDESEDAASLTPGKGKIKSVKRGWTTMVVKYKRLKPVSYYQVALKAKGSDFRIFNTCKRKMPFKGLYSGHKYIIKVRGVKYYKGNYYYGKWSALKKVKMK